jgi:hypothetical protein
MGSTLSVTHLRGLTSGNNANEILLDSGHEIVGAHTGQLRVPGMVVQTVQGWNDAMITSTGSSMQATGLKVEITPKFANSKFYSRSLSSLNARPAAHGVGVMMHHRNKTTSGTMTAVRADNELITGGYLYSNDDADMWGEASTLNYEDGPSYTVGDTLEFELYFASVGPGTDGSTTARHGHGTFQNTIVVQEIAT